MCASVNAALVRYGAGVRKLRTAPPIRDVSSSSNSKKDRVSFLELEYLRILTHLNMLMYVPIYL